MKRARTDVVWILAGIFGVSLLCSSASAQTANGRSGGTVSDESGAVIGGAGVTVTDNDRGLARNLTTDEAGAYSAPNLLPGTYTVRVVFPGFQAWVRANIRLEVGRDLSVDATLAPGAQTETVNITEEV